MDWSDLPESKEFYFTYCGALYETQGIILNSDLVVAFRLSSAQANWVRAEWHVYYTKLKKLKQAIAGL